MAREFLEIIAEPKDVSRVIRGNFIGGRSEPRVAFAGRSNVGKSSLLNALIKKKVARVSSQPGKTRSIIFYDWPGGKKILVDLPGYGFAKVPQSEREQWRKVIELYLREDPLLEKILILLDSRHGPTELDFQLIDFLSESEIPIQIVFTKSDKLKTQSMRVKREREVKQVFSEKGISSDSFVWSSVSSKNGLNAIRNAVCERES